jgi:hypothetical protein
MTAGVTTRISSPPESQKTVRILPCATGFVAALAVALLAGHVLEPAHISLWTSGPPG